MAPPGMPASGADTLSFEQAHDDLGTAEGFWGFSAQGTLLKKSATGYGGRWTAKKAKPPLGLHRRGFLESVVVFPT
jgi:hypothetical protein